MKAIVNEIFVFATERKERIKCQNMNVISDLIATLIPNQYPKIRTFPIY